MYKFKWQGNDGRCYPKPGIVDQAECGICGTQMNVERNVNAPTGSAEALGGGAHLHDCFTCPHFLESWHNKIVRLKWNAIAHSARIEGGEEVIGELEKKVKKILEDAEKQS